jgi:hypothetical protein
VTWRAFIGEWPGDHRTEADERGLTWERARDVLAGFAGEALLLEGGADGCDVCAGNARQCIDELRVLPEGTEWSGDIDWDELRLIRE